MKVAALDHPKTKGLKARLQCSRAQVIGHLELLWAFAAQHAAQGDIGKWGDEEIAEACDWTGSGERGPQFFVLALVDKVFLDRHDTHRLLVHDWPDHAPRWVLAKLKREKLDFIVVPTTDATTDSTTGQATEATADATLLTKARQGKREKTGRAIALPEWLDAEAWGAWEAYRRECRKPLTASTVAKQLKFLEQNQPQHAAILEQSIRNGWQGLFDLKDTHGNSGKPRGKSAPERVRDANAKFG